jgi:NAD(P)-dependent dehydrogenase (short-subunit alcohol dehydrogenase family)
MNLQGAVAVVTGGASGIGRALALRFAREGARAVVVADLDEPGARRVARELTCATALGAWLDVTDPEAVAALVERVEHEVGAVDLWCSNAGVALGADLGSDQDWHRSFQVHVMAHVHVARALLPRMAARGRGHLLVTASAAGLLTQMDAAAYSVTKHGSVALAEWLAIRYGDDGVTVSCLCPQGVRTPMLRRTGRLGQVLLAPDAVDVSVVGDAVLAALGTGQFLVLPHPEVAGYLRTKADDPDGWLSSMNRLQQRLEG